VSTVEPKPTPATPRPEQPRKRRFGALRHRDFRRLWIGLIVSNSGTWAQNVAQTWLIYQLSNSRLTLGLLGVSFALPMVTLPLLGGVLADRFDRLSILKCTQSLAMALAAVLAIVTLTGHVQPWHIIVLSFLGAVALATDNPTRHSLIPALVPRGELSGAMALNSIVFTGAGLIGSAIAGLVLHGFENRVLIGCSLIFGVNSLSYLAVLIPLFGIHVPDRRQQSRKTSGSPLQELNDAWIYLRTNRALGLLICLSAATNLFGRSFLQLMPVLARDTLHTGMGGLGAMHSVISAGTIIGGLGLAAVGGLRALGTTLNRSVLLMSASVIGLSFSRSYWGTLVILLVIGAATTVATSTTATGLQRIVDENMRGRVMSYYTLTLIGLPPLGGGIVSGLAQWIPVQWAIILPATILLLYLAWLVLFSASWKRLRDED
jgi:MFS family permease